MIIAMIAAVALQAAAPQTTGGVAATPAKPAETKPAATKPAEPEKKICRREAVVGSSIESRICKTKAQWDAEAERARTSSQSININRTDAPGS